MWLSRRAWQKRVGVVVTGRRRVYRVAEKIRELIAGLLHHSADPRFALVTVTGVTITPDLGEAKVFWNVSGRERREETEAAFRAATGYFRGHLAQGLGLRTVPRLRFFYDDTLDTAEVVQKLLERIGGEPKGQA